MLAHAVDNARCSAALEWARRLCRVRRDSRSSFPSASPNAFPFFCFFLRSFVDCFYFIPFVGFPVGQCYRHPRTMKCSGCSGSFVIFKAQCTPCLCILFYSFLFLFLLYTYGKAADGSEREQINHSEAKAARSLGSTFWFLGCSLFVMSR